MDPIATGVEDKTGRMIHLGDIVLHETSRGEFVGKVVFEYGAYRFSFGNGIYLQFNSSLLYRSGGAQFTIIKQG